MRSCAPSPKNSVKRLVLQLVCAWNLMTPFGASVDPEVKQISEMASPAIEMPGLEITVADTRCDTSQNVNPRLRFPISLRL